MDVAATRDEQRKLDDLLDEVNLLAEQIDRGRRLGLATDGLCRRREAVVAKVRSLFDSIYGDGS